MEIPDKQVFTTGEIARICTVAPRTVSTWVDSGRLKGYRLPGSLDRRVPRSDLIAFLKDYGMLRGVHVINGLLTTPVWDSCNKTAIWGKQEQCVIPGVGLSEEARILRSKLILEEALETITALGCEVTRFYGDVQIKIVAPLNLESVIDGCCDLKYVTVGTLVALNIPDSPHDKAVCEANEAKFVDGKSVPHPTIPGKYGKPDGWKPPNHLEIMKTYMEVV